MLVESEIDKLGIIHCKVELGEVPILNKLNNMELNVLRIVLMKSGFELLSFKKDILVERIKTTIIEMIHIKKEIPKIRLSDYLSDKLHHDYTYLANTFKEITGNTIEKFVIAHKIEKTKEYIIYDELSLSQIASKLNYSSICHLSTQFKKETGINLSDFKQLKDKKRTKLENINVNSKLE